LGENAKSVDVVGIEYPDGTIQGDKNKVKMRYVSTYMDEAAAGKIAL
jgi:NitT/TauT family transport system substrate-binding protein